MHSVRLLYQLRQAVKHLAFFYTYLRMFSYFTVVVYIGMHVALAFKNVFFVSFGYCRMNVFGPVLFMLWF